MTVDTPLDDLEELRKEVAGFMRASYDLILVEGDLEIFHLASSEWRLAIEFGKLMLEVWSPGRSFAWRVESIAYRDDGRLGLFVRRPGGHPITTLELREKAQNTVASRDDARSALRRDIVAFLKVQYPGWRLESVSNRTDREFSFSAWYTRGLARRGRTAWAFLALSDTESPTAGDAALAHGLNWLTWLRERHEDCVVSGLKLFLPSSAIPLAAQRAAGLNPSALQLELFEWPPASPIHLEPVDLKDIGNIETRLIARRGASAWRQRHSSLLEDLFGDSLDRLQLIPEPSGFGLSLRVLGLEVGRLDGFVAPRFYWGVEGRRQIYSSEQRETWQRFLHEVLSMRNPSNPDHSHEFYRLQPERWLESLLVHDVSQLDPALSPDHVYPQVPAFSAGDRGVVDILGVLRGGRIAVIELKLHEELTLPLQALDYWLRVKWLNDRNQFQPAGYFQDTELSKAPPVLYLVSPAFRFHSTTQRIVGCLDPSINAVQVGINQQWRKGVKVLFRRRLHAENPL